MKEIKSRKFEMVVDDCAVCPAHLCFFKFNVEKCVCQIKNKTVPQGTIFEFPKWCPLKKVKE